MKCVHTFGTGRHKRQADIILLFQYSYTMGTSYTMGCPPVPEDDQQALASGLSYVQADNPWYNYSIPPTSV